MTARYATSKEIKKWDDLIVKNPDGGNVFSSSEYAEIKKLTGYTPRYIIANKCAVLILEKKTPPLGTFWYLPKGPGVTTSKQLFDTLEAIRPLAKKAGAFVMRVETELDRSSRPTLERYGMKKAAPIIPNPSTITIDISEPLETVLANLPQKGRHAIRRAGRDGVTVKRVAATEENAQIMYALLSATAEGQFGIRNYMYYKTFWQTFEKTGRGQLFFAYFEGAVVAGAYAMVLGEKSTYKDGASVRERTAYGASHLLQWNVIEWAKEKGALIHDFCGSPPSEDLKNPNHPHYGVGLFKLSFSKDVHDFIGCYDLVLSKIRYTSWLKVGERAYRHFYYKQTKDYYY